MTERRSISVSNPLVSGTSGATIRGLGVPFNVPSSDMGFIEYWDAGAFDAQRNRKGGFDDVVAQIEHASPTIGRVGANTLRLSIQPDGLHYEIDVPDSVSYIAEAVGRGDICGASWVFRTTADVWDFDGENPIRMVMGAELIEIGPVTWPCFPQTTSVLKRSARSVRSLVEARIGKKISAATAAEINAAIAALRGLLEDGDGFDDEDLLDQALESDSIPAALEKDSAPRMTFAQAEARLRRRDPSALTWLDAKMAMYEREGRRELADFRRTVKPCATR